MSKNGKFSNSTASFFVFPAIVLVIVILIAFAVDNYTLRIFLIIGGIAAWGIVGGLAKAIEVGFSSDQLSSTDNDSNSDEETGSDDDLKLIVAIISLLIGFVVVVAICSA